MKSPRERQILSSSNPTFRSLLSLLGAKGIKDQGQYLLFGERVVREALAGGPKARTVASALLAVDGAQVGDFVRALPEGATVIRLSKPLFDELDVFGTRAPILVCETPAIPEWRAEAPRGLELLLALSDPANLGACLRSAGAFGASKAILLKECASPYLPRATRAASGLTLATPLERGPSIRALAPLLEQRRGPAGLASLIALDMKGAPLPRLKWPRPGARLLLGEEGQGVPDGLIATRAAIPMAPGAESLNAAAALSVALYAWQTT